MRLPRIINRQGQPDPDNDSDDLYPEDQPQSTLAPTAPVREDDVTPPSGVYTADVVRAIRFDVATPQGYYFTQVEHFHEQAIQSLTWYEQEMFRLRQRLHSTQVEADQQAHANQQLRAQMEVFRVNGPAMVNPDGSFVRESQIGASGGDHDRRVAELETALQAEQAAHAVTTGAHAEAVATVAARDEEIVALREWIDQVAPAYEALQQSLEASEAEVARLSGAPLADVDGSTVHAEPEGHGVIPDEAPDAGLEPVDRPGPEGAAEVREADEELAQVLQTFRGAEHAADVPAAQEHTEQPDQHLYSAAGEYAAEEPHLPERGQATEPVSQAPDEVAYAEESTYTPETVHAEEVAYAPESEQAQPTPVAVPPTDSELPPGVELPRSKYDREYPPAAPGAPLHAPAGVPLEHWAPELYDQPVHPDGSVGEPEPVAEPGLPQARLRQRG